MIALLGPSAISRLRRRDPRHAVLSLAVAWPLRAELPVSLRPSIEPYRNELVRRLLRSGRRSPTSAVRPSSRARSRALDPHHAFRPGERRVPKHAPAETTEIRRSAAHVSRIRWLPQAVRESRDSPLTSILAAEGPAFITAPRREATSTRPDAFRYLEPRSDVAFAKRSPQDRLAE